MGGNNCMKRVVGMGKHLFQSVSKYNHCEVWCMIRSRIGMWLKGSWNERNTFGIQRTSHKRIKRTEVAEELGQQSFFINFRWTWIWRRWPISRKDSEMRTGLDIEGLAVQLVLGSKFYDLQTKRSSGHEARGLYLLDMDQSWFGHVAGSRLNNRDHVRL